MRDVEKNRISSRELCISRRDLSCSEPHLKTSRASLLLVVDDLNGTIGPQSAAVDEAVNRPTAVPTEKEPRTRRQTTGQSLYTCKTKRSRSSFARSACNRNRMIYRQGTDFTCRVFVGPAKPGCRWSARMRNGVAYLGALSAWRAPRFFLVSRLSYWSLGRHLVPRRFSL